MAKSLTRIIGEGTFWSSFGTVGIKVVGLATIFLILSRLSVYEYGLVKLVLSVIPMLSIFLLPGLTSVVTADMSVEKGKGNLAGMKSIFLNYFKLQMVLAAVAWAIVFFGSEVATRLYDERVGSLLKIISFLFLTAPFRTNILIALRVHFRFFQQSVYTFVEESLKLAFIALFFFILHISVAGVLVSAVLAELVTIALMTPVFLRVYRGFGSASLERGMPLWALLRDHGKWSVFSTYLNSFGGSSRLWIVKFLLGTEVVGLYAVAQGLISHVVSLVPLGTILSSVIPQYVTEKERFYRLITKGIKYQLIGYVLLGIAMFFVLPPVIVWLFPHYEASMPLFKIMLFALGGISFATIFTHAFFALREQKSYFFSIVFKVLSTLILSPALILLFGITGVAFEYVTTASLLAVERYVALRRRLPDLSIINRNFFTFDRDDDIIMQKVFRFLTRLIRR